MRSALLTERGRYIGPQWGQMMRIVVGDVTDVDFGPGFNPEEPPGGNNPPLFDQIGPLGAASHVFANLDPETIYNDGSIDWDFDLCEV